MGKLTFVPATISPHQVNALAQVVSKANKEAKGVPEKTTKPLFHGKDQPS